MDIRHAIAQEIPRLRRYARALLRDGVAADDLVQDTLERALRHQDKWRPGTNLRAWLFTVQRNLHLNGLRGRARAVDDVPLTDPDAVGRGEGQTGRLAIRDLARALDRLPVEQREAVLLVGLEDMSYKEAAEVLDVPVGTVMSRLSRGRERLRVLMDGGEPETARPTLRRVK